MSKSKGEYIGKGKNCRDCNVPTHLMKRKHPGKLSQLYYYTHWEKCPHCYKIYFSNEYKEYTTHKREQPNEYTQQMDFLRSI